VGYLSLQIFCVSQSTDQRINRLTNQQIRKSTNQQIKKAAASAFLLQLLPVSYRYD